MDKRETKYKEILRLKELLAERGFEKSLIEFSDGYQIRLTPNISVIECSASYGNKADLLELYGGLTTEEEQKKAGAVGYLTAEEILKRFLYCIENKTTTYKKEIKKVGNFLTRREMKMLQVLIGKSAFSVEQEGTPDGVHTVYKIDDVGIQKLARDIADIFCDDESKSK